MHGALCCWVCGPGVPELSVRQARGRACACVCVGSNKVGRREPTSQAPQRRPSLVASGQ